MKSLKNSRAKMMMGAIVAAGVCSPALADFGYANFASTSGMTLVGSAAQSSTSILLTPSSRAMSGAAWYTDAKQDVSLGFEASMTIRIPSKSGGGADGFALVIQNTSPTALGGNGGGVGYGQNPVYGQAGIANSIALEVDMWDNTGSWADLSSSHISLQSRGLQENSPDQGASLGAVNCPDMSEGNAHTIRLVYIPGLMSVYVDGASSPALQAAVDLSTLLSLDTHGGTTAGQAWVGVTASTGSLVDSQAQELMALSFTGTQVPAPGSAALVGAGILLGGRRHRRNR